MVLWLGVLLGIASAAPAATTAGTVIRNQASATYTDADGRSVSVTSNLVETTVGQVAGLELESDQTLRGVGGQRVRFAHRVRNTGNGDDRILLSVSNAAGDSIDLSNLAVYADADADGVPDTETPIEGTAWLGSGEAFGIVVAGTVPVAALDGDTAFVTVLAISQFDASRVAMVTDTLVVGTGAAIAVTKSIEMRRGLSPSGPWTVTLRYENTGTAAAGDVTLIDTLPPGMRYVPGSGVWSGSTVPLSDADPGDVHVGIGSSVRYCAYHPSCTGLAEAESDADADSTNQVTAVFDLVAPGLGGSLSFDVSIDPGLPAGRLPNRAEFEYDIAITTVDRAFTNTVGFEVLPSAGVIANGSNATAIDGMAEPVAVSSAAQGGIVTFDNIIWNTGNRTDSFDIVVDSAGSTFPPGTVWRLLKENGATPLLDTSGNGLVDTGPIAPGTSYRVVLVLELPEGVSGDNGGAGYRLEKTARSVTDPSISNAVVDELYEIVANRVDVTNQAPAGSDGALGAGPGPEPAPVSTVAPDGAGIARFDLHVRNQGAASDRYRLVAHGAATRGPLPPGWHVRFVDPSDGTVVADTGVLASGASRHVRAELQLPRGVEPGRTSLWFEAVSALSGASDLKHDAVDIAPQTILRIEPGLSAQLEPGGSVVYEHIVGNTGNATVDDAVIELSAPLPGWTATAWVDTDGSGTFGAGDFQFSGTWTLAPGEQRQLFVRVVAPVTAPLAQREATLVSVRWDGGAETASVTDLSTVSRSLVSIRKEQALDTGCDGAPDPGTDFGPGRIEVRPGANCVIYRLTATNGGRETSFNVKIHDYTPAYTLYRPTASCSRSPCWLTEPGFEVSGTVSAETDQLVPGAYFSLKFSVRVQ